MFYFLPMEFQGFRPSRSLVRVAELGTARTPLKKTEVHKIQLAKPDCGPASGPCKHLTSLQPMGA